MSFLESLRWRYATKRMNGKKVPAAKVEIILEAARLAPSSAGLQPFNIIVVKDPELLKKIQPIANNQPQITEASHLLIFAAWDDINDSHIDAIFDHINKERNYTPEAQEAYKNRVKAIHASKTQEERFQAAAQQAYISFGVAIAAAAVEEVDATPMGGFNPAELDKLLGLREKGLRSVTLLALGYRDVENDKLVHQKKVRKPKEEFIIELN
jgi:nitroreductase/dihydropteridine reductase